MKEQDSLFESISDRIKKELHQSGINDLIIRLTLDYQKKIWRDDCVAMVVNACLENYNFIGLDFIDLTAKDWESIVLLKAKKWNKPLKITPYSRMKISGAIHEQRLQREIENKNNKLLQSINENPLNHQSIEAYWLLLAIEGSFNQDFIDTKTKVPISFDLCFHKVFVFHRRKKWAKEIITY